MCGEVRAAIGQVCVEQREVANLAVVGSIPTLPLRFVLLDGALALVAQLAEAADSDSVCCGFESRSGYGRVREVSCGGALRR